MDELMTRALAPGRYRAALATLFAVLALALTAVGVAGLAARGVAARLPELCIRMALGATQRRAVSLVVRASLGATAIGIAMGLLVGFARQQPEAAAALRDRKRARKQGRAGLNSSRAAKPVRITGRR